MVVKKRETKHNVKKNVLASKKQNKYKVIPVEKQLHLLKPKKAPKGTKKKVTKVHDKESGTKYDQHDLDYRLALGDALFYDKSITVNYCDLAAVVTKPILPPKDSQSNTIILLGKLNWRYIGRQAEKDLDYIFNAVADKSRLKSASDEVVLKIGFKTNRPADDNSLEVERIIYEKLIRNMPAFHYTPNVILPLGFYECTSFGAKVASMKNQQTKKTLQKYVTDLKKEYGGVYDYDTIEVVMMEKGKGSTLWNWFDKHPLVEWYSIIFQTLFTLEVFNHFNLRHNDLHANNIWIVPNKEPRFYVYFIDKSHYAVVPMYHTVKIYDFDRGWFSYKDGMGKTHGVKNTLISKYYCVGNSGVGQCEGINHKFDAFKFLWEVWATDQTPMQVKKWIEDAFFYGSDKWLSYPWAWDGQMCKVKQTKGQTICTGDWEMPDSRMRPVRTVLRNFPYFVQSLPTFDKKWLDDEVNSQNLYFLPYLENDMRGIYEEIENKGTHKTFK
jgi:hypothetical protein